MLLCLFLWRAIQQNKTALCKILQAIAACSRLCWALFCLSCSFFFRCTYAEIRQFQRDVEELVPNAIAEGSRGEGDDEGDDGGDGADCVRGYGE